MSLRNYNVTKLSFSKRYFLLPIILIVFFLLFYLVYNDIKDKTINEFNNEQLIIAQAASQGINSFFQNYKNELTFLSQNKQIIDFNDDSRALMEGFYNNHKNFIEAVTRVDGNGKILYTYPFNKSVIGQDISFQKHVHQILTTHQPVISDVFMAVQGYLAVALHVPVFKGKEFKGSLAILIQIDKLGKLYFEKIKDRGTSQTWLLSENGIEIYCPIKGHKGKSILEITHNDSSTIGLIDKLKKENKGTTKSIHPERSVDGHNEFIEKYIAFYRVPLGNTYWTILISYNEEEIYAALTSFRNRLIVIFSFLFIVMAYYFYSFTKVRTVLKEETKRKEAEKALHESEEDYKKLFENHSAVKIIIDPNTGSIFDANHAAAKYYGWTREEMREMKIDQINVLTPEEIRNEMGKVKDNKQTHFEFKHRRADGLVRDVDVYTHIINMAGNEYLHSIIFDSTERKRTEVALKQANLVVENSPAVLFRWKAEEGWPVAFVSQNVIQFGYSPDELLNGSIPYASIIYPEDLERVMREIDSKAKLEIDRFQQEYRILRKDGTICWVDDRTVVERNSQGQATNYQGIVIDITERKQAEEALRKSERQYHDIFQFAPVGIYQSSWDDRFINVNNRLVEILGYDSTDELMNQKISEDIYFDPQERSELIAKFEPIGSVFHHEIRWKQKNGVPIWISLTSHAIKNKSNSTIYFEGFAEDITERKLAEEAFKESENKFRSVVEEAVEIVFTADKHGYFTYVNPAGIKSSGYSLDDLKKLKYIDLIEAEHKHRVKSHYLNQYRERKSLSTTEYPFRTKSGEIKWFNQNARLIIENDEVKGFYVIARDVTERRKAEEALQEKETRYRTLFNLSPSGIVLIDTDGKIIDANESFCKSVLYTRDELTGKSILLLVPEERHTDVKDHIQKIQSGIILEHVVKNVKKDGTLCDMELRESLVLLSDGRKGILTIANDITQRRLAEEKLQESEKKFRSVWEKSTDGMRITNEEGFIIMVNDAYCRLVEKTHDEIKGKPMSVTQEKDRKEEILLKHKKRFHTRNVPGYTEKKITLWNGNVKYLELSNTFLEIVNQPTLLLSVFRDVTQRKNADETIKKSEEKYRLIVENSHEGIEISQDDLIIYSNNQFAEMLGYTIAELKVMKFSQIFTEQAISELYERQRKRNTGELATTHQYETTFIKKDRTIIHVSINYEIIEYNNRPATFATIQDITERKRAVEALRESESKFRSVIEEAVEIVFTVDNKGYFTYVNPAGIKSSGYSLDELTKLKYIDLVEPTYKQKAKHNYFRQFKERRAVSTNDFPFCTKSGEIKWFNQNVRLIIENDEVKGFYVISRDITDRRKAEEAMRESEEKFRSLVESINEVFYIANKEGKITYCSPNITSATGFELKEILGNSFLKLIAPIDRRLVLDHYLELTSKGGSDTMQVFRVRCKDGTIVWAEQITHLVRDKFGGVEEYRNVTRDITDRKNAEDSLRKSREDLMKFFEDDLSADYISTPSGKLLNCNKTYLNVFGFKSKEEALAFPLDKIYPDSSSRKEFIDLLKTSKRLENFESEYISKYGIPIYAIETAVAEIDNAGELIQIRGYIVDITERKKAEEGLKKLSRAVEQSPVSVIITNKNGDIEYVNEKFCEVTGYSKEEVIGKNPSILNSGHHDKNFYTELWNTILECENWEGEMLNKKKNEELYWESVLISPLVNIEGNISHFVAVKEDITEKKMILEELIEAKEKAEQSNKLKDAFIANMSHEIRTPLNGILGLSSIVKTLYAEHIKEEDESIFEGIDHSSNRIIRTVDMILNYSRIQTGEFPISPIEIELSLICENLVKEFAIKAKSKLLEFSFDNRCGKSITVFGDEYSVTHSISNLIDNAIKYTDKGFIKIILYNGNNDEIMLDIKDSGIGISKEYLNHVFEPYQQEHLGYGRAYEGVGLGLSMVKKFLDLNKAEIFVTSEKGKGSTFTINFGKALPTSVKEIFKKKTDKTITGQSPHNRPLILLVEDDVFNQAAIKIFVEKSYDTIVTDSSDGALNVMKNNRIDLILMDISIKGNKNGLELTKDLKASTEYSQIPIIAITAHAFESDKHNALKAGCDDYLSKPFSKSLLLETIGKFV